MAHVEEPRRNVDGTWSTRVRYRVGGRETPLLGHPILGLPSREAALTAALEDKGFAWRRGVGRIEISAGTGGEVTAAVRVTQFPTTGHAALRWYGDYPGIRHDVEAALPAALAAYAANRNPAAGWLYTAAASILVVLFAWTVVVIYLVVTDPRG